MTLAERLKKVLAASKMKHEEFALSVGIKTDRFKNLLSGKVSKLLEDEARKIRKAHGFQELWLLHGRGPLRLSDADLKMEPALDNLIDATQVVAALDVKPEYKAAVRMIVFLAARCESARLGEYLDGLLEKCAPAGFLNAYVEIPLYDVAASAGPGSINGDEAVVTGSCFNRDWLRKRHLKPDNLFVIHVTGQSMEGKLSDGDTVLVDKSQANLKSGYAYVLRQGEELLVKYCQLLPDGVLRVSSENKSFQPYDIDLKRTPDVSILGRVVASKHEW